MSAPRSDAVIDMGRIERAIAAEFQKIVDEEKERIIHKAVVEFEAAVRAQMGSAVLAVNSFYSMEQRGPNLVITVQNQFGSK